MLVSWVSEVSCFLAQFVVGSRVQSAAEKLDSKSPRLLALRGLVVRLFHTRVSDCFEGELSNALAEIRRLRVAEEKILVEEDRIREARRSAHARLIRLKKVREKIRLKKYRLIK